MSKHLRKIFKVLKISSIILLLIFLATYILIQVPKVQTWLVNQVTKSLTKTLQTKVSIKKVNIDFFKTAVLEGIYIEDQQSDTLLFAEKLKVDIGVFSLFQNEIFVNKIQLEGAVVNLTKEPADSLFNFQFIIDAFSSDSPKVEKQNKSTPGWRFGIDKIIIENTRFSMSDKNSGGFDLKTQVGNLTIDAEELDFAKNKIALSGFNLDRSSVAYSILKNDQIKVPDSTALAFPAIGWTISVDDINLKDNRFKLSNFNYERQVEIVDYNFLNFEKIALKVNDLSLNDTAIIANIQQVSLTDHSGFQLNNLSAEVNLNNRSIAAEKIRLETPQTSLKSDIHLTFEDFGDLADFMDKVKLEADFKNSQVAYRDLTNLVAVLKTIPVVKTDIDENISLDGSIILEKNNLSFKDFDSKIGKIFSLQANGSILNLTSDLIFDLNIKKLKTDYAAFTFLTKDIPLPEGLSKLGKIDFSGQIKGTLDDLKGKNIDLITQSTTQFKGDLNINGLPDIENTIFKADVESLATRLGDIQAISGAQLPTMLDSLGLIKFQGEYEGTIYKFLVNGDFQSDAGDMSANLDMDFEKDYQNAKYNGTIELTDFDLSKIIAGPFGLSSLNVEAKGSGLNINDLDLTITGAITDFNYQDYTYHDLSLNGAFLKKRFDGFAKAKDENMHFDFKGMVDFNDSLPDFQLALNVDTINLQALNLYTKNLGFSGNLEANLKGNKLDNINGVASLKKFNITQDSIHYSTDKTISLKAESPTFDQKGIHFRSEFMDANIVGKFDVVDFPRAVIDFIDGFFPIDELVLNDSTSQDQPKEQDVAFDFKFKEIAPFAQIFLPDFSAADTAFIKGKFNSEAKRLVVDGSFPKLTYGDFDVDTIRILSNGTPKHLETTISVNQIQSSNSINLPFLEFYTMFANDTLNFGLSIIKEVQAQNTFLTDTIMVVNVDTSLELKGNISYFNETYALSFLPEFILNNDIWNIADQNKIEYSNNDLTISNFNIKDKNQEIAINSFGNRPENDFKPIEIRISNFNLGTVSNLLGMTDNMLGGKVDGDLVIKEPKANLHYNSEVLIKGLSFNDKLIGDLDIAAKQPKQAQVIDLSIKLTGESQMSVAGNYEVKNNIFDLDFQFGRLPLFLIDPFLTGILKDSDGFLNGEMKVKGSFGQPDVNGTLYLNDFKTTAVISNMQYRAEKTAVQISEKAVSIGTIQLKDSNNNTAVLSGRILHNYFQNIIFDLNFKTDAFQFLKTTVAENDLYFGDLFLKASVAITGTPELPVINIDASTLPKSHLFVQPFSGEETVKQENYVVFGNPESYNEDSLRLVEQRIMGNRSPFDLSLKIQVTKDATLNIIIDPDTEDQLISVGTANLILNISPTGIMTVAGSYTIEKGSYSLNYEQLIKRDFEINKGSTINFSGDPMNASFDVTATYKVRASTYELLSNQSTLSDAEKQAASERTDVIVLMNLRGNINNPKISFDIQIPENNTDGLSSVANRKLAELRLNPEELNKQAFGLLLFKSFISETNSAQTLSGAGSAMALSSVSSLITDQLNNFADRYIQGFEVDFGVESYNTSGVQSQNVTKMGMSVSKELFHDRLTVKVGTNVNLASEGSGSAANSGYSDIAGDFLMEYKLTESGNYLIKVFHKSDYNVLEQNNVYDTGAGIIFRKSFNGKKFKE